MKRAAVVSVILLALAVPASAQQQPSPELQACQATLQRERATVDRLTAQLMAVDRAAVRAQQERDSYRSALEDILDAEDDEARAEAETRAAQLIGRELSGKE